MISVLAYRTNRNALYPEEKLYIFGKCIRLLERYGNKEKDVHLYIKINRLVSRQYVIVVSIHEQKFQLKYYFRQ